MKPTRQTQMSAAMQHTAPADRTVEEWEAIFQGSTCRRSRNASSGHVHVVEDAPASPEPTRTEHGSFHGLILFTSSVRSAEERLAGGEKHFDSVCRGDLHVYSRDRNEHAHFSRWGTPVSFISVMLAPPVVAQACRAMERDYAPGIFIDSFKTADPLLHHLVRQLGAEVGADAAHHPLYVDQLLLSVAVHLVQHYTASGTTNGNASSRLPPERLRDVTEYVAAHLSDDIKIADLADVACYSQYHFCRLFKESTGQSPYQFVVQRRMEEAMRRLQANSHARVSTIARKVGYSSPSHFSRAFKKHFGVAPSTCQS
jgi:AraC-like DNA-binding protein